jgi:hypothetical protein
MAASASAGYDIPQRLKTLHNLVGVQNLFHKFIPSFTMVMLLLIG